LIITGVLGYAVARWFSEPMNRELRARLLSTTTPSIEAASN